MGNAFIPEHIIFNHNLSPGARLLFGLLSTYGSQRNTTVWPSQALLCEALSCERRTVSRYLAELREAGVVTVIRENVVKSGHLTVNRYRLNYGADEVDVTQVSQGEGDVTPESHATGHQSPKVHETPVSHRSTLTPSPQVPEQAAAAAAPAPADALREAYKDCIDAYCPGLPYPTSVAQWQLLVRTVSGDPAVLLARVYGSDFLMGRKPGKDWRVPSFLWLVNHIPNLLAGEYDNGAGIARVEPPGMLRDVSDGMSMRCCVCGGTDDSLRWAQGWGACVHPGCIGVGIGNQTANRIDYYNEKKRR